MILLLEINVSDSIDNLERTERSLCEYAAI